MLPPINPIFNLFNALRVKYILRGLGKEDVVHIFTNSPIFAREAKKRDSKVVVDIIHNWWEFPYHPSIQLRNLKAMLGQADLIISDSPVTLQKADAEVNKTLFQTPTLFIPPGVHKDWLKEKKVHSPKNNLDCVFFGNFRANSDIEIILQLIEMPKTSITLYGLIDPSLPRLFKERITPFYRGKLDHIAYSKNIL